MYNDPNQQNPNQPNQSSYNPNQPYQPPYNPNQPNQSSYNPNQPNQSSYNPNQPGQPYQQQPYPPQGFMPPQPPKVKHTKRNLGIGCGALIVVLAICGIIAAVSNSASKNIGTTTIPTGSTTTNAQATKAPAASAHFKVGDVVKVGDWQVTVNSVKTSNGSEFIKPTKGQFLLLDVSVVNTSSTEQDISSLLNFKLMDSTGISYTETITGDNTPNPPDGKVEAGAPSRGTFTYDVPTSMKAYTFLFEPDITATGESIWDIKP